MKTVFIQRHLCFALTLFGLQAFSAFGSNGVERGGGEDLGLSLKSVIREVVLGIRGGQNNHTDIVSAYSSAVSAVANQDWENRLATLLVEETQELVTRIACHENKIVLSNPEWMQLEQDRLRRYVRTFEMMMECLSNVGISIQTSQALESYTQTTQLVFEDESLIYSILAINETTQQGLRNERENLLARYRSRIDTIDLIEFNNGPLTAWSLFRLFSQEAGIASQLPSEIVASELLKSGYHLRRRQLRSVKSNALQAPLTQFAPRDIEVSPIQSELVQQNLARIHFSSNRSSVIQQLNLDWQSHVQIVNQMNDKLLQTIMSYLRGQSNRPDLPRVIDDLQSLSAEARR